MKTLLIIGKPDKHGDFGQLLICPKCKTYDDLGFDSEEYIGANCLYMCCARYLICPTGNNGDIINLQNGIATGCTLSLTKEEAEEYMLSNNIILEKSDGCYVCSTDIDPNNCYYYLVSLLNITRIGRFYHPDNLKIKNELNDWTAEHLLKQSDSINFKYSDNERVVYKVVNAVNIDSITTVSTSHDGIYLYYRGECTECDKCYESFITGD